MLLACMVGSWGAAGCESRVIGNDGLVEGQCGLSGQRVECMVDSDCPSVDGVNQACDWSGDCYPRYWYDSPLCETDDECPHGLYCVGNTCLDTCDGHDACSGFGSAYCACGGANLCRYERCQADHCPEGFEAVDGSSVCRPLAWEGDCRRGDSTEDCPDGYTPVGTYGCALIEPADAGGGT